jgi:[CysO sulfur-carrier protein]-S-L-cysteine hydrolase
VLSEPQIQRYARQLLLRDVGERGQEALGAVRVLLGLDGEVASTAAAYLRAGGTEVEPPSVTGAVWADTPPLLGASPLRPLTVWASPALPEREGIVVGARAGAQVLWSLGEGGCAACLRDATRGLGPPDRGPAGVQVGTLVALLAQRRALGIAAPLEGLEVSAAGTISARAAPACTHRPPAVPPDVLAAVVRHLSAALPDEGCAVLVGGGDDGVRVVPMVNAQDVHHARDPEAFPRSARTAFSFEPRAWLALLRATEAAGERILAIAHSHPDGGEHFSAEDRRMAAPDGLPLTPGVAHLVVAFRPGRAPLGRWVLWINGDFAESECPLPQQS